MIALQVTSMKKFMAQLLTTDTFDSFCLEEAVIGTGCTISIDGHVNTEFYANDEEADTSLPEFRPWSEMRTLAFDLIKGKRTPLFFRFVLHLMPEKAADLLTREGSDVDPSLVKALVLGIRYDGTKAVLTTGTSYSTFVLSKEPDQIWDKALEKFLALKGIEFEKIS